MNTFSLLTNGRGIASSFAVTAIFFATTATAQIGVVGDTGIDASGKYEQERTWCMANTQGVARVDCLKNSAAARAEKRRGTLDNNGENFEANALMRCEAFTGQDRAACRVRVKGFGNASGSVQGGGIIKQVETVVLPEGEEQTQVLILPKRP